MRQVLFIDGRAVVEEVPVPRVEPGRVLVRTWHSVLSAGTERDALNASGGTSLLSEATEPDKIRRAIEVLRSEGPAGVISRIRERGSSAPVAPGYAASGVVEAVGRGIADLPPGTRVACSGAGYASHAEWIVVPRNLVVPVPPDVPMDEAAFATLGAIALQGVRRSGLVIGETAVVIGLGLIGRLGAEILRAAGVRVLAFDTDPARAARGREVGLEAYDLAARDPRDEVPRATGGLLADAVLVYATSKGSEATNLAMRLCRRKGTVVLIGAVGMDLDRSLMYEKELDLRISTSYGPGRYDPSYEEKGIDYPPAYVRWTENRNMAAFLDLLRHGRIRVRPLVDRIFPVDQAPAAYDAIEGKITGARPVGIVLNYAPSGDQTAAPAGGTSGSEALVSGGQQGEDASRERAFEPLPRERRTIGVGLCGAGAFVKSAHVPVIRRMRGFGLRVVATATPLNAREAARRFGIPKATTDLREALQDPSVDLILIGTRHHLHAAQASGALRAGKHVLVEKPLCLDETDVAPLLEEARRSRRLLAVGFNRRYSPLVRRLREVMSRLPGPSLVVYRVNAGALPAGHWLQDPEEGGGRVIGECCHFVDLLIHLLGESVGRIGAVALPSDGTAVIRSDSFSAHLEFNGGSRATLIYTGLGDASLSKERLEIFKGGTAIVLDDFRRLTVHGRVGGSLDLGRQDKGIAAQWEAIECALRGEPSDVITPVEIEAAMRATFRLDRTVRGER
jgi:predicted dehydrogenase/threonine dehydrogenase-like Zn-dependent dehydrogenase